MEQDEPDFSNLLGIPIHGLLGYTLFKDFIIEINYDGHYLILHTPKKYTYKLKRKQISIPLSFIENKPYIEAVVIQDNNAKIPVKLMMDLGGSHSLWFNLLSNPSLQLPQRNAKMTLGVGLNGLLLGRIGRLKEFALGRFEFRNILSNYPDTTSMGNALKLNYRNGSIGSGLLSRFNLIVDYRNQKLTLTPNKHIKEPFLYNINFPPGVAWPVAFTQLGRRSYHDEVEFRRDPRGREYLWLGGPPGTRHDGAEGTDTAAFDAGAVGITPLSLSLWSVREAERMQQMLDGFA